MTVLNHRSSIFHHRILGQVGAVGVLAQRCAKDAREIHPRFIAISSGRGA
jgi:hypothetical protein